MGVFYSGGEDGVLVMFTPGRPDLICKSQLFTEPILAIDDSFLESQGKKKYP